MSAEVFGNAMFFGFAAYMFAMIIWDMYIG